MIKKLVFDLDGTLWDTRESYLYSYKKLCEYYNIVNPVSNDKILTYLGVKLDILIDELFPFISDKEYLAKLAVNYSIEYVLENQKCLSNNIYELFKKISSEYEIYIISNCPVNYLKTFFQISNVSEFVTGYFTIENGSKENHLKLITNNYEYKAIFVSDAASDYEEIVDHSKIFFCYAKYGYKPANHYDYSINSLDEIIDVLKKIHYKDTILKNDWYEIISSNDSNITLIRKKNIYYFGFINFTNTLDDSIVINDLKKKINNVALIGPIDGNTWYPYRISLDNLDFKLYPDCINDQYMLDLFLNNNFKVFQKYTSTLASINYEIWQRGRKVNLDKSYEIKVVRKEEYYLHLDELYEVAVDAFKKADYYEAISQEDFKNLYLPNIKAVNPDLILVYYRKKLVAFNFCYEDLKKRFYVCKTVAVMEKYRSIKLILKLIEQSYNVMASYGYSEVLYHFQNDRTKVLYSIFKNHIIKQKYYGLLRYQNDK